MMPLRAFIPFFSGDTMRLKAVVRPNINGGFSSVDLMSALNDLTPAASIHLPLEAGEAIVSACAAFNAEMERFACNSMEAQS